MNLPEHKIYTRKEFNESKYCQSFLSVLIDAKIERTLDIGACTGEITKILLENIPTIKECVMVEPIQENVDFIKNEFKDTKNVVIHENAVFYNQDYVDIGKIGGENTNVGGGSVFNKKEVTQVKTIKLEELGNFDFVKIDVEGAERNIIENSTNLQKAKFIDIEFHHYDGELQHAVKREPYLKWKFPNHKILIVGERNIFLSL